MTIKDRLVHYNRLVGPTGERLATFFRFQNRPSSDYPRVYLPYDSLLNHKSRLVRETKFWLGDLLSPENILEIQLILICHDVHELYDGDESRLAASGEGEIAQNCQNLLPDDIERFKSFLEGENFLENGREQLPQSPLAIIARALDTIDGNYFAFALLENYALIAGNELVDPILQRLLDRSYAYVNKMRVKYRNKIAQTPGQYELDLVAIYERLLQVEAEKISRFSESIRSLGYTTGEII